MMKYYSILLNFAVIAFCVVGCFVNPNFTERYVQQHQKHIIVDESTQMEIGEAISQLTSPDFFIYTQAARKLIEIGPPAICHLYQNRRVFRESNDTVVPVCLLIIKIIVSNQDTNWITGQLQSKYPEVRQIASAELEKRNKENSVPNRQISLSKMQ